MNTNNIQYHSEVGGRTMCRLLVRDTAGETESTFLNDNVPAWVTDVVIERTIPKFFKIPFYLLPHPQMIKQERMKKVNVRATANRSQTVKVIYTRFFHFCFCTTGSSGGQRIHSVSQSLRTRSGQSVGCRNYTWYRYRYK